MENRVYQILDTALMDAATTFFILFAKVKHLLLLVDMLLYVNQQLTKYFILQRSVKCDTYM